MKSARAATYPGEVWSFSTADYAVVDDFESYTDKAGGEIFTTWVDGYGTTTNGSQVGYVHAARHLRGEDHHPRRQAVDAAGL